MVTTPNTEHVNQVIDKVKSKETQPQDQTSSTFNSAKKGKDKKALHSSVIKFDIADVRVLHKLGEGKFPISVGLICKMTRRLRTCEGSQVKQEGRAQQKLLKRQGKHCLVRQRGARDQTPTASPNLQVPETGHRDGAK